MLLVTQTPGEHLLCHFQHDTGMRRILGEVVHLIGIVLKIEEQGWQGGEMHIFPASTADDRHLAVMSLQPKGAFRTDTAIGT